MSRRPSETRLRLGLSLAEAQQGPNLSQPSPGVEPNRNMLQILKTMTIQEAAALWSDPLRAHLGKWEREFNQPLEGLHVGHVITYQTERHREVDASVVNLEVDALRALLKEAGCGQDIEQRYEPLNEGIRLKQEEFAALPSRIRAYISGLEQRIAGLESENDAMKNKIRKHNWGRRK